MVVINGWSDEDAAVAGSVGQPLTSYEARKEY
jgi:hypothetical protein